jgi:glycosyltransferase involved in cell wall biosynthesis
MPELIDHGVAAIARLPEIDRAACRAAVASRFTVDRMADRYLELYRSILG